MMSEFSLGELVGTTCQIMQGEGTCRRTLEYLSKAVMENREFSVCLLNYTKSGRPFMNTLHLGPLKDNVTGETSLYVGLAEPAFLDVPVSPSCPLRPAQLVDAPVSDAPVSDAARQLPPFLTKLTEIVTQGLRWGTVTFEPLSGYFIILDPIQFADKARACQLPTLMCVCEASVALPWARAASHL